MSGNLKKLLLDERIPAVAGFVKTPPEGGNHWDYVGPAGNRQLLIHVVTKGSHASLWCHPCGGMRAGRGIWAIPDIGTEVLVSFDNGDFEGDPFIVGLFGRYDDSVHTLVAGSTLIVDSSVEIRSATGIPLALTTKADMDAHASWAASHFHTAPGGGGPTTGPTTTPPTPSGTQILKAE